MSEKPDPYVEVTCKLCGKTQRNSFCEPYKTNMVERQLCFSCNYWTDLIEQDKVKPEEVVVTEQTHYLIAPDNSKDNYWLAGFGGSEFRIAFNDGRRVVTHNLWCQGSIPDHFKQYFPENAHFERP